VAIKEMQIKTTLRFHFTPVRIGNIKNTTNNNHWQRCGEKGTLILLIGSMNTTDRNVSWYNHLLLIGSMSTTDRNVSWYNHFGKQYGDSLKN
jgi:hypothetical protein